MMSTGTNPPAAPVTLQILDTPDGVLVTASGDLDGANGAASVARTLCRLTVGLFEGAKPVRLDPEIARVAL